MVIPISTVVVIEVKVIPVVADYFENGKMAGSRLIHCVASLSGPCGPLPLKVEISHTDSN